MSKNNMSSIANMANGAPMRNALQAQSNVLSNYVVSLQHVMKDMFKIVLETTVLIAACTRSINAGGKISKYFSERWPIYSELIQSSSPGEFVLKFSVYQMNFQVIDYFAVIVGLALKSRDQRLDVILGLIDNKSVLDDALKNPKILKMLMKISDNGCKDVLLPDEVLKLKKVIAHILTKFPSMKKMNFMFKKSKGHISTPKFSDKDIAAHF